MGATMLPTVVALAGATAAYSVYSAISSLRANIAGAKRSGLKYVVAPCSPLFLPWQLTHKIWVPVIRCLPRSWWEDWLDIMIPDWSFHHNHEPFSRFGEAFFIVSPYTTILFTDNAEVIRQMAQRREQFPKLTETYKILAQFGESVLTTEGAVWRMHRKATSASFNERNAALVFAVAAQQAQGMIDKWREEQAKGAKSITTVDHDTMRLALNIIGYVGFGLRLLWPGQSLPPGSDPRLYKYTALEPAEGHSMSFIDAIAYLLENILMLLIFPAWVLRLIPSKKTKLAADAHENYVKYMDELLEEKIDQLRQGDSTAPATGMDLMGQLARSTYGHGQIANGHVNGPVDGSKAAEAGADSGLTKSDIIGNAFIMLVAGHETTANALHFTLLELAAHPAVQRNLQKDIDTLFGDKDPQTWNYEGSVGAMTACMIGACMNETLRKMPSVVEIPKKVYGQDQTITMDGKSHVLPKDAIVLMVAVAVHRNPRYWPTRPSRITDAMTDIDDYVPGRWFLKDFKGRSASVAPQGEDSAESTDAEDFGGDQGRDTSSQLFRPERGAYIPFSEGARSCLGRRIAQGEIMAALAVIFQRYSIELAVDEWASDDEVAKMGTDEKAALYKKAQDECRRKINSASSVLTLKLQGSHVPVRLVKRGEERFMSCVDE